MTNSFTRLAPKLLTALALIAGTVVANAQEYNVTELPALGGNYTGGAGINDSGQVTGFSGVPVGEVGPHAFIYSNGTMQDLGTLGNGGRGNYGQAINASGQVTGFAYTASGGPYAFVYSDRTMQNLGTLGGPTSYGLAINASGQVVGYSDTTTSTGDVGQHAFLYSNGTMQDLGTLGGRDSYAYGINDSGQITGYADTNAITNTGGTIDHAFIYSNGTMQDLGTLGGTQSFGLAINGSGQVTGYSNTIGNSGQDAFIYSNGTTKDLGTLGGRYSEGLAINASGEVTGFAYTAGDAQHAFLYDDGSLIDLNSELSGADSALYTLTIGQAINDSGEIVAEGYVDATDQYGTFLLTPTDSGLFPAPEIDSTSAAGGLTFLAAVLAVLRGRRLTRTGDQREWSLNKSRDGEDGARHAFNLRVVSLGMDTDGLPLSSCVVMPDGSAAEIKRVNLPQGGNQKIAWEAIKPLFKDGAMGKPGAPPYRRCIEMESAITQVASRLLCAPERRTERAREAITGLASAHRGHVGVPSTDTRPSVQQAHTAGNTKYRALP